MRRRKKKSFFLFETCWSPTLFTNFIIIRPQRQTKTDYLLSLNSHSHYLIYFRFPSYPGKIRDIILVFSLSLLPSEKDRIPICLSFRLLITHFTSVSPQIQGPVYGQIPRRNSPPRGHFEGCCPSLCLHEHLNSRGRHRSLCGHLQVSAVCACGLWGRMGVRRRLGE